MPQRKRRQIAPLATDGVCAALVQNGADGSVADFPQGAEETRILVVSPVHGAFTSPIAVPAEQALGPPESLLAREIVMNWHSCLQRTLVALLLAAPVAAHAATVVGGSDLLPGASANQLESWLNLGSLQFTNIYDKAPGDSSVAFHKAADGKGPTVFVMEATLQTGGPTHIIGGYNPQSWNSSGTYNETPNLKDRTAFIFDLTSLNKRAQIQGAGGQYQTYNNLAYGPTFGGGHDIYVHGSLSIGYLNPWGYCSDVTTSNTCFFAVNFLGSSYSNISINIGKLEVFSFYPLSPVPLPGALVLFGTGFGMMSLVGWWRRRRIVEATA